MTTALERRRHQLGLSPLPHHRRRRADPLTARETILVGIIGAGALIVTAPWSVAVLATVLGVCK